MQRRRDERDFYVDKPGTVLIRGNIIERKKIFPLK